MGFTDVFNWATDKVKHCPNVIQPVGNACRSSYSLGCAAVLKVENVVGVNASHKVKECIPGPETWQKIGRYAHDFLESPLAKEVIKYIPGANWVYLGHETYKHWSRSIQVDESTESTDQGRIDKVKPDAHLKCEKKALQNVRSVQIDNQTKSTDQGRIDKVKPDAHLKCKKKVLQNVRSVQIDDQNTKSIDQGRIDKVKPNAHLKYEKKVLQSVQARTTTSGSSRAAGIRSRI